MRDKPGSRSLSQYLYLLCLVGVATSCQQTQELAMSNEWTWLWLAAPAAAIGLIGAILIYWIRRAQLLRWDLREQPVEPVVKSITLWLVGVAGALSASFAVYIVLLDIVDPRQKAFNIGAWLFGTVLGIAAALFFGLSLAERPHSLRRDDGR